MPAGDSAELQEVFRYAAGTLGERVLRGRRLKWKPGVKDTLIAQIKAAKRAVDDERRKLNQEWRSAKPTANATRPRSGFQIGAHRAAPPQIGTHRAAPPKAPAWQAAKPSNRMSGPSAVTIGTRAANGSRAGDAGQAALRLGSLAAVSELLREGATGGLDMFLDPDFSAPTFELGFQGEPGPLTGMAIDGIADLIRQSGLLDGMLVDMGAEIATEIASALPVIGAAVTLSQAAAQSITAAIAEYKAIKLRLTAKHITPGQPEAALQAVRLLYDRKAIEYGTRAAIGWTAGGLMVGGLFADFGAVTGPLLGIFKAVVNLAITIVSTCLVLWEMRAGNKIIAAGGPFDVTLLGKSPILGTYLLTEAESSTLYAYLVSGPLPANWQDQVEGLMSKVNGVIRSANAIQRASPFMLEGGSINGSLAKGDHFLDTRLHKSAQRFAYEAKIITQRDPRALKFLSKHMKETVLGKLPIPGR